MPATLKIPPLAIKSADLRPEILAMQLPVRDQNPRGTCTIFATAFLLEFAVCRDRSLTELNFSEEYLNAAARLFCEEQGNTGAPGDGSNFLGAWQGYNEYGIVDEEWFPYKKTFDPHHDPDAALRAIGKAARFYEATIFLSTKPPTQPGWASKGLDDAQMADVIKHVDAGNPIAIGVHLAEGMQTVNCGGVNAWNDFPDETKGRAGHSIAVVGYYANPLFGGGGYFIFRNSWGPNWGDKGYGYLTFDFARKYVYDAVSYSCPPTFKPGKIITTKPYKIDLPIPTPVEIDRLGKLIHPNSRIE